VFNLDLEDRAVRLILASGPEVASQTIIWQATHDLSENPTKRNVCRFCLSLGFALFTFSYLHALEEDYHGFWIAGNIDTCNGS